MRENDDRALPIGVGPSQSRRGAKPETEKTFVGKLEIRTFPNRQSSFFPNSELADLRHQPQKL